MYFCCVLCSIVPGFTHCVQWKTYAGFAIFIFFIWAVISWKKIFAEFSQSGSMRFFLTCSHVRFGSQH